MYFDIVEYKLTSNTAADNQKFCPAELGLTHAYIYLSLTIPFRVTYFHVALRSSYLRFKHAPAHLYGVSHPDSSCHSVEFMIVFWTNCRVIPVMKPGCSLMYLVIL